MSRHGYSCDLGNWEWIKWRGQVTSSIRGKRGQRFLREMADALDEMEEKRLIRGDLIKEGECCALRSVAKRRGRSDLVNETNDLLAVEFGVTEQLVREVEFVNDDFFGSEEDRWREVRSWLNRVIAK